MIKVVNKHKVSAEQQAEAFYIGRGSALGNPFKVKPYGPHERGESVQLFEQHIRARIKAGDKEIRAELNRIWQHARDNDETMIMCFCAPRACHGDVIKKIIEEKM